MQQNNLDDRRDEIISDLTASVAKLQELMEALDDISTHAISLAFVFITGAIMQLEE